MKRKLMILLAVLAASVSALAQTPVQSLMAGFEDVKGVNVLVAEGRMMTIARGYIRKSPMGPLADSVDEVTILNMKRASDQVKQDFLKHLHNTLHTYIYYGKKKGMNGNIVDVYGCQVVDGVVHELIVFNPENGSLFSMRGSYPVDELQALDK